MEKKLKLAVCQLRTELDQDETMEKAARMLHEAARNGAQIVVLPEMFNCPYSREYFQRCAGRGHEAAVAAMSGWARENGVLLVGGSIPELHDGKLYNSCFVFDEEGRQIARHRKVHLFDVDLPGMRFRESDTFAPGEEITTFETRSRTLSCHGQPRRADHLSARPVQRDDRPRPLGAEPARPGGGQRALCRGRFGRAI